VPAGKLLAGLMRAERVMRVASALSVARPASLTDNPTPGAIHDDRDVFQASPDELPAIDIHSL